VFARQSMLLKTGLSESVDMLLAVWLDEGSLAPGCMLLVLLASTVKGKKLHIIGYIKKMYTIMKRDFPLLLLKKATGRTYNYVRLQLVAATTGVANNCERLLYWLV